MKALLFGILVVLLAVLLASPVTAMMVPVFPTNPMIRHTVTAISKENTTVDFEYATVQADNIITAALEFLNIVPASTDISVKIGNDIVAIIPEDSKFKDVIVHDSCLSFGYGTDMWYACEEGLQ